MVSEWRIGTIGEVAEKVAMGPFGSSIKVETFVSAGVPVISGQHLHSFRLDETAGFNYVSHEHAERLKNSNVRKGDVIFTHAGNIGQVSYIPANAMYERYVISQRQFYMRCNPEYMIPEFVVYYFNSPEGRHQLLANTSQVGVPSIAQPVSYLRTIEIPVPPLPQQRAIAHILGTLDDKIELNRRMNETLEAMARALFKSWFVDFDPVRAKADGRDPALPPHLAALFPDRLQESELGEVPEGWGVGTLCDLAEVTSGKRPSKSFSEPVPGAIVPLWGGNGPMAYVAEPLFTKPILLTGRVGTLGSVFRTTTPCWPSDNTLVVLPRRESVFEYLFFNMKRIDFDALNRGSTQPLLTQTDLKNQTMLIPFGDVLDESHKHVADCFAKLDRANDESRTLAALRDTLLPKLVSGELRVRDVQRFIGRAV